MNLGAKVRRLRSGRSFASVSRVVGCSPGALRQLEAGAITSPRVSVLLSLSREFGVSLDWLADDSADWPPPAVTDRQAATEAVERVLAAGGLAGELTDDEREIVSVWRSLSTVLRARASGYVIGLATGGSSESGDFGAELSEAIAEHDSEASRRGGRGRDSASGGGRAG